MAFDVQHYLIDHRSVDWTVTLREWDWLLPPTLTVWLMNRFGDLFLVTDDGSVSILDVGAGTLNRLAGSRDEFADRIDEGRNANVWLMIPLVDELIARGVSLRAGECYSYKKPPVVGGAYTSDNAFPLSIPAHFRFYAHVHRRLKDAPDGTKVRLRVTQ